MNSTTVILKWLFKAGRILFMSTLVYQAIKYGVIFSAAGMPVIVILLCALMVLALADIYRAVLGSNNTKS